MIKLTLSCDNNLGKKLSSDNICLVNNYLDSSYTNFATDKGYPVIKVIL